MKDDIRNIINLENITRVRSSLNDTTSLPDQKFDCKINSNSIFGTRS